MSGGVFEHWPNRITAMRFVGSVALFGVFAAIGQGDPITHKAWICFAFWLFVITAATDFLDGYLARRDKVVSAFGRIADPFTDKVLILGTMTFLCAMPWSREFVPAWVVVVILAREFLVTGLRGYVESLGKEFPADWFGKVKMIVQCCAVGNVIWIHSYDWPDAWLTFWRGLCWVLISATVVTTLASGLSYIGKTRKILMEGGE